MTVKKTKKTPRNRNRKIDITLGLNCRALRYRANMSLAALGKEIGVTYQQVLKYETGDTRIAASTLYKISHALEADISEFFKGVEL